MTERDIGLPTGAVSLVLLRSARQSDHMPSPGKKWRHVIINTRGSWLHGDERGFRSRGHRIHSSGDYKHGPPEGEHEGLHGYQLGRSKPEVQFPLEIRPVIGRALIEQMLRCEHRVVVVAVTTVHAHILVELPDNIAAIRSIVGYAKRHASRCVKSTSPGQVWAGGGTFKRVTSRSHQRNAYEYILYDQGRSAWTWCFQGWVG